MSSLTIQPGKWKLLYRGSRDGLTAANFHEKCDGLEGTMTVVRAEHSRFVFGGYTSQTWNEVNGSGENLSFRTLNN